MISDSSYLNFYSPKIGFHHDYHRSELKAVIAEYPMKRVRCVERGLEGYC